MPNPAPKKIEKPNFFQNVSTVFKDMGKRYVSAINNPIIALFTKQIAGAALGITLFILLPWYALVPFIAIPLAGVVTGIVEAVLNNKNKVQQKDFNAKFKVPEFYYKNGLPHVRMQEHKVNYVWNMIPQAINLYFALIFEPTNIIGHYVLNLLGFPYHAYKAIKALQSTDEAFKPEVTKSPTSDVVSSEEAPDVVESPNHDKSASNSPILAEERDKAASQSGSHSNEENDTSDKNTPKNQGVTSNVDNEDLAEVNIPSEAAVAAAQP